MAIILLLVATLIATAFADDQQLDQLETMAMNILSGVHTHLGGESGQNSLYTFVSNSEFARQAALELTKTRRERIEEGVGSEGITFISVTKGKKQVNVTTTYGVGAGAVINVKERDEEADVPSFYELGQVVSPLYDQYVSKFSGPDDDKDDAIHVHLGSEGHTGFKLRDPKARVEARVVAGFQVGAKTTVSKKG